MFKFLMVLVLKKKNVLCIIIISLILVLGKQDQLRGPGRREIGHGALGEEHFQQLFQMKKISLIQFVL